jgi:hypothetical protein
MPSTIDITNWSDEWQETLKREAAGFAALGINELAMRIAVALHEQDSCSDCLVNNMRNTLFRGEQGYIMCDKCVKEFEVANPDER